MSTHADHMAEALALAGQAAARGEVPVGAVLVREGRILSRGRNRREEDKNALAHAEIEAIRDACAALGSWRLENTALYVTLEPCPMCMGAIINARIPLLVFGADDPKAGCCGSVTDLSALPFNHRPEILGGIRAEECAGILREFFRGLRE